MAKTHNNQTLQLLARAIWRRHKGGFVRRAIRRLTVALYQLAGSPVVSNTSCSGALIGASGSCASSVPLPP